MVPSPPLLSNAGLSARVVFTADEIRAATIRLAAQINSDYKGHEIHLVGVLKGAFVFLADLLRHIQLPCSVDFVRLASYGAATATSGEVTERLSRGDPVAGRHVIVVEEIVDSGLTLARLLEDLRAEGPASLKVCALLDKAERRQVPVPVDYRGFSLAEGFVIGYGLDFDERFRNLPAIYVLDGPPPKP